MRKTTIVLSSLLLVLGSFFAAGTIPMPAHAQLVGTVCIDNAASTSCPASPPSLTGIVGENITVSVNIQGSDTFTAFDISVATNASVLDPLSIDLSASLLQPNFFVAAESVNSTTGVAVVSAAATLHTIQGPATGNLFRLTYRVVSASSAKIGYLTPCNNTSNDSVCVTVLNPNVIPENVQIANFIGTSTPDFVTTTNPHSLTIRAGSAAASLITLTSVNGFTGTISLSGTISPIVKHGPAATFSVTSVTLSPGGSGTSTLTVDTAKNTPAGSYAVTVTGVSGSVSHSVTLTVSVTPFR